MTELLLIDMSSILYPLFHVLGNDPNPNAISVATVDRVRKLASSHPFAAICCDSGKTFRNEIDPSYKATRESKPASLWHQYTLAMETLVEDGFPVFAPKGYEADDAICSASFLARQRDEDTTVLIVSADKDLYALVGPRVKVKNLTSGDVYGPEEVFAKFGVWPEQMTDFLSLCGDKSDNIVGAKGIGDVKAAAMLDSMLTLEGIYEALDRGDAFKPATKASLLEFRPRMETVRSLVRMRCDVPIDIDAAFRPRVSKAAEEGFGMESEMEQDQPDLFGAPETTPNPFEKKQEPQPEAIGNAAAVAAQAAADKEPPAPKMPEAVLEQPSQALAVFRNEPAPAPQEWSMQLEPRSMTEAAKLAEWSFKSTFFSAYPNPQACLMVILAGRERGMQTQAALDAYHVIEGKPRMSSDLIRGLIMRSGKAKYFRCTERTATQATFETQRVDDDFVYKLTFTIQEGRAAFSGTQEKWEKSGWGRNPADMCVARASSKLGRLAYADVVHNLISAEEVQD